MESLVLESGVGGFAVWAAAFAAVPVAEVVAFFGECGDSLVGGPASSLTPIVIFPFDAIQFALIIRYYIKRCLMKTIEIILDCFKSNPGYSIFCIVFTILAATFFWKTLKLSKEEGPIFGNNFFFLLNNLSSNNDEEVKGTTEKSAREHASSALPEIAEELRKESGFPTGKAIIVVGPAYSCNEVASSARHEDVKLTITLSSSYDESSGSQSAPLQTPRE